MQCVSFKEELERRQGFVSERKPHVKESRNLPVTLYSKRPSESSIHSLASLQSMFFNVDRDKSCEEENDHVQHTSSKDRTITS